MNAQMIRLTEISVDAIPEIRSVNENSESFKELKNAIEVETQKYPIIIREFAGSEIDDPRIDHVTKYGIIDGHNRYRIAELNGKTEILATIITEGIPEDDIERKIFDTKMALNMNATIPMTLIQKGRIISELHDKTGRTIQELGESLFGVGTAMAYRYVQIYDKHVKKRNDDKPRNRKIEEQDINDLNVAWNNIPHNTSEFDFNDIEKSVTQIQQLKILENKLSVIRRILLSKSEIRKAWQKKNEQTATNENQQE